MRDRKGEKERDEGRNGEEEIGKMTPGSGWVGGWVGKRRRRTISKGT